MSAAPTPHHLHTPDAARSRNPSIVAAGVTVGFAAVVAMWVVWFLTNLPALNSTVKPAVSGPLILFFAFAVLLTGLCRLPREDRIAAGALCGLIAGLVNLLALGSQLTTPTAGGSAAPGATGLKPDAGLIALGFIAAMVVTGLIAGFGARSMGGFRERRTPGAWLGSFAVVNAAAILPLLTLGGLVTSAKAGFAVPDWPGTYGANMFLYPVALMSEPRIFLEHSHRLFGTMVGVTTFAGLVFALAAAPRPWLKAWAAGLFVLVCLQGVAGGVWTQEKARWMVVAHGITGQVYFALTCAYAAALSERWWRWRNDVSARASVVTPSTGTAVLLALLVVQLTMGTLVRHLGSVARHALYTHIALSLAVLITAIVVGTRMMRLKATAPAPHNKGLWLAGHNVVLTVGLQFVLGWIALLAWMSTKDHAAPTADQLAAAHEIKPWEVLARTAHQANGALLLGMSAVMGVWGLGRKA